MGGVAQMSESVRQAARDYLAAHQVMTVATQGPEGIWAAAVFYANNGFDLFFLSAAHTRHGKNMAADATVAATIQEDYEDWPAIQGIQLEGQVSLLAGQQRAAAVAHYLRKYPFMAQSDPQIIRAVAKVNWYRLRPSRVYFIDNSKGLGHRDEVAL